MDVVELSRLQFALTAMVHFLFVPLTLGLSVLLAYMEVQWVRTGDQMYLRMVKFWGRLFLINFAMGVVTGLTMALEFGLNWAEYSAYVGDIFGAPLAAEAMTAFFLEATFIGVWIFGWDKISPKLHALSMCLIAFATNLSGLWILLANGFMQHPVGYEITAAAPGIAQRVEMVDFLALFTNPVGLIKFGHTVLAGYVLAAFFVMGVSAYHLLKKNEPDFFKRSFRIASVFGLAAAIIVPILGDFHGTEIAKIQPAKLAAIESHWETESKVPFYLFVWPDEKNERNAVELLGIPGGVSFITGHDFNAEVTGLKHFPKEDRPPVLGTFLSFRFMVLIGLTLVALSFMARWWAKRDKLMERRWFLRLMLYAIPLPYIAIQLGWIVAEVGRQPWIVYGLLRTEDAVSRATTVEQLWFSLIGFVLLYGLLITADAYLLTKFAKRGPEPVAAGDNDGDGGGDGGGEPGGHVAAEVTA